MKKVIIVGGGFLGAYTAKSLEYKYNVTLIDTKDYFEFTPGILRTIVDPKHIKKVQVLHEHYLKKAKFVNGRVTTINKNHIILNDKKISFDYLVLGLGSKYQSMIKQENVVLSSRAKILREAHTKLIKSENIVIVGGGVVGVELAAEIAVGMPKKNVTLIHSRDTLMQRNHPKVSKHAASFLNKKGVKTIFGERVQNIDNGHVTTQSGKKFKSDMVFMCVGIRPNSEPVKNSFPMALDEKKHVKVNEYLQLEGCSNIFAAGDFAGIKEEKTAQGAEKAGEVIVRNIQHLEKKEKLEKYEPTARIMVISLGKWNGSLEYKGFSITGIIPGLMKSIIEWKAMVKYKA
jgi:apoptosis-inducing factor 2